MKKTNTTPDTWEIKDRVYLLKGDKSPILFTVPAKHSRAKSLLWFDEDEGLTRELRYATNQNSPFVDEQKGTVTLGHIFFRDGKLIVPKQKQNLQKLLSLYHPLNGVSYYEKDDVKTAEVDLSYLEMEIEALKIASSLNIDDCEALLRVETNVNVPTMTSKEIKRDTIVFARNNPQEFLRIIQDEDMGLKSLAMKAVDHKIIRLAPDGRAFVWAKNGKKLMTVPFDQEPYPALAAWFKTDEGMEVFDSIQKKIK
jgi:hypothetical protein